MRSDSLKELINTIAKPGRLDWIGLRPARREAMQAVEQVEVSEAGLVGDHGRPGKRAVTLIQHEHLAVIGAFLGHPPVDPAMLRRNLTVSGINLLALKGRTVQIGTAKLEVTGPCAPCSRMEEAFSQEGFSGGYSAVRGHGGVTASIVEPGVIRVGDQVSAVPTSD
jgi:MOSC domain-containing protein YiiM